MMKKLNILFKSIIIILLLAGQMDGHLMAQEDSVKPEKRPLFSIRYFNQQNQIQFLQLHAQVKTGRVFEALEKLKIDLYLDDAEDPENKIASLVTDAHGKAFTYLPPSLKDKWKAGHSHLFIAKTDSVPELGPLETEMEITKARMSIETVDEEESRQIKVKLEELQDSVWTAVPDVEMKIGIKRQGSMLPVGEDESYTTDSTGYAMAEYAVDSIPGDANGNIFLIAKIEDHNLYGNLEVEKEVAWGKAFAGHSDFGKRSLWATGDKVPLWLMSLAVVIILSVWSTLLFLIVQVFKIRRLGTR